MAIVENKMAIVAALILIQYMISLVRAGWLTGSVFRPEAISDEGTMETICDDDDVMDDAVQV